MNKISVRRRCAAIVAAAAACAAVAPAAQAAAPSYTAYTPIKNMNSGKLLDLRFGSTVEGAVAVQHGNRGWGGLYATDSQRWQVPMKFESSPGTIRNQNSGLCLTTDGVAGHALSQYTCTGASNQLWQANSPFTFRFGGLPTNPTYFQNPATGLVIDVAQGSKADDAVVVGWYYNGGSNQLWDY